MQRVITGLWLSVALAGQCQAAGEPPAEPPVYRYLFLVEAGASMARQKDVALDTVHQLILSRMNGRIQRGDVLGIWPFKSQVDRKLTRPIHWSPVEARDLANFIYRKLRDLDFSKESKLEAALTAAAAEASRGEALTVFLITSGTDPVRGTPFDREINAVFEQHREGMIKAKRPFVCALVYEGGELVAQAVTPGGMTIFIPPSPTARAAVEVEPPSEPAKPEAEAVVVAPAVPKPEPMGVDEIEAKLREAEAARLAREAVEAAAKTEVVEAVVPTRTAELSERVPVDGGGASVGEAVPAVPIEPESEEQLAGAGEVSGGRVESKVVAEEPQAPARSEGKSHVVAAEPVGFEGATTPAVVLPGGVSRGERWFY
ncbi:MAG: hypothetical protein KJ072_28020, partial [Verrucomicrobia bacterium]|nr:hypothetical protein [Verrucomicrobiota bacterium]